MELEENGIKWIWYGRYGTQIGLKNFEPVPNLYSTV